MSDKEWHYRPAVDLDQSLVERLSSFPRQPDMLVYGLRSLAALLMRGWLRVYHRLTIVGRENLPASGSFVIVANHASHLDALCLLAALPLRKLHRAFPAAARDYFFVGIPRTVLSAVVVNALPFSRKSHVRQSLDLCRMMLENSGNILIVFPEGTRCETGAMGEFRAGIGFLVAQTQVPVVPCLLDGTFAAWPRQARLARPRRVRLVIGEPRDYAARSCDNHTARWIAADLQQAIRDLQCK